MDKIAFPIIIAIVLIGLFLSVFLDRKGKNSDQDINIYS
jgi:hypothetical protein